MNPLATLIESEHPAVLALADATAPTAGKWDNRASWDNNTPAFDNRPTWDNWDKKK
ncbi:hypothetical protein KGQ19_00410 [Catenulispora sp. NL8]|uniref:Uncharacterized protein n=1 Tax=Catenulispora pinistramenti TaxID=2705254 RepID=A0ABS5KHG3_9ACTN|nr:MULTISPECIES: multiple cyclophane-containing RiPP AmcA [Catenulispora]MBS2545320.1 hypothetical protein [Catenulispora pinistramenti]